ncbi:MAG: hypothetical protein WCJ56_09310 [bacterium]
MTRIQLISFALAVCCSVILCGVAAAQLPPPPMTHDQVIAALDAKGVNVTGLNIDPKDGGAFINLGTSKNGGENTSANDENLGLVAQLPEVERIIIYKGTFSKSGLARLAALPKLKSLNFYAPQVDPKVFSALADCQPLRELFISGYPVSDELLGYLGGLRDLQAVEISESRGMTSKGLNKFLAGLADLQDFLLFGDSVDNDSMILFGKMIHMKRLWISSKRVSGKAWENLAGMTDMRDLHLGGTTIDDAGVRALKGMTKLEALLLENTKITDDSLTIIATMRELNDLGLGGTAITDDGMALLTGLTKLKNLYIGDTLVSVKGLAAIPNKNNMGMMRIGHAPLTPQQYFDIRKLFPNTEISDDAGFWSTERIKAALNALNRGKTP